MERSSASGLRSNLKMVLVVSQAAFSKLSDLGARSSPTPPPAVTGVSPNWMELGSARVGGGGVFLRETELLDSNMFKVRAAICQGALAYQLV